MAQKHVWMHAKLEDGSPNPDHLPNWMNTSELPEPVQVDLGGIVHTTTNGIHLGRFLQSGGRVVDPPEEEAPPAHTAAKKAKE